MATRAPGQPPEPSLPRQPITLGQAIDALLEESLCPDGFVDKKLARRLKDFQEGERFGYFRGYEQGREDARAGKSTGLDAR